MAAPAKPPASGLAGIRRRASVALQEMDAAELAKDRAAGSGALDVMAKEGSNTGKPGLRRRMSQGILLSGSKQPGLRRHRSQELADASANASEAAPPVVLAKDPAPGAPPERKLPKHLQVLVAPVAGMCAGALEITSLWPMEWAKVQVQLHKSDPKWSVFGEARRLGFGLYRGLPSMLVGVPLQGAVRFSVLDSIKAAFVEPGTQPGPVTNLCAGLVAGTLEATLVVTPVETVKTRLVDANKSLLRGMIDFVRAEGPSGIYRGLIPTIAKSASNQALRFGIFGEYKRYFWGNKPSKDMPPLLALGGGMTAGAIGSVITMPFDVIKTRMQGLEAKNYNGTFDCVRKVLANEGVGALYKGLAARLGRAVPGQGIIFASYEVFSQGFTKFLFAVAVPAEPNRK